MKKTISATSFSSGGSSISDGGGTVSAKGIVWGHSANPTLSNNVSSSSTGTSDYTRTATNLDINTTYHYRAYITNESGTSYGEDKTYTTPEKVVLFNSGSVIKNGSKNVILK